MRLGIPTKKILIRKAFVILGSDLIHWTNFIAAKATWWSCDTHMSKDADETPGLICWSKIGHRGNYHLQTQKIMRKIFNSLTELRSDGASFSDAKIFDEWEHIPRASGTWTRAIGKVWSWRKTCSALKKSSAGMTSLPANKSRYWRPRYRLGSGYADQQFFDAKSYRQGYVWWAKPIYNRNALCVVNGVPVLSDGAYRTHARTSGTQAGLEEK